MTTTRSHESSSLLWLEVPVDDAHHMEVVQRQGQLGKVELDVFFSEHDLLGESSEEVAATKKLQHQVQLAFCLKRCNRERGGGVKGSKVKVVMV